MTTDNKPWKKRPAPEVGVEAESDFSAADLDSIVGQLSEQDLRARSTALDEAQETWEEVAYLANPKMPCPECSGAGMISGGSLGDVCVRCMGQRVVEQPGRQTVKMPPFAALRAAITRYGDAIADRALPGDHRAKKQLALPEASTVPSLEEIAKLHAEAIDTSRQLQGSPGLVDPKLLKEPQKETGMRGEGALDEIADAELDQIESEADEA